MRRTPPHGVRRTGHPALGRSGAALLGAAALLASSWTAGCTPTIVATAGLSAFQAGTSAFANGQLEAAREADIEQAWGAVLQAVRTLDFEIVGERPPYAVTPEFGGPEADPQGDASGASMSAFLRARDDTGGEIKVRLRRKSSAVTQINIRIGLLGDQALSRLILAKIDEFLPGEVSMTLGPAAGPRGGS